MTPAVLSPRALAALEAKYQRLLVLRRQRDRRGPSKSADADPDLRRELRELAAAYPGCLRELDTAGEAGLQSRHEAARARQAHNPTLMAAWHYHGLMAAALRVRAVLVARGVRKDPDLRAPAIAAEVRAELDIEIDDAFVRAIARPPGGRLNAVVMRELSKRTGRTASELTRDLFPPRRIAR